MSYVDDTPLEFGKYKGKTPRQIAAEDPWYIVWMYETIKPLKCSKMLYNECENEVQRDNFVGCMWFEGHTSNFGDR